MLAECWRYMMNETQIPNDEWKFIKDSVYTTKKLIDVLQFNCPRCGGVLKIPIELVVRAGSQFIVPHRVCCGHCDYILGMVRFLQKTCTSSINYGLN